MWLVAPEGVASAAVTAWLHGKRARRREARWRPSSIPFLDQDRYDELLWACDLNFVRGEDSFVRAQWAARPFVWHIYPTDDGAHWVKLAAFLARYTAGMDRGARRRVTALWEAWNRGEAMARAWPAFDAAARRRSPPTPRTGPPGWPPARILPTQLVDFADNVLK